MSLGLLSMNPLMSWENLHFSPKLHSFSWNMVGHSLSLDLMWVTGRCLLRPLTFIFFLPFPLSWSPSSWPEITINGSNSWKLQTVVKKISKMKNIGTRWKGRITHYDEPTFLALFQFVFSFLRYVGCIQFWFVVNTNKSKINKKAQVVSVPLTIYCIYRNLIYNSKHFSKQFGNEKFALKLMSFFQ